MKNGMSKGINGFLLYFYMAMWDTTSHDTQNKYTTRDYLFSMAYEVFTISQDLEFLNQVLIKSILKELSKDSIGGWLPMTFLTTTYKIMAKELLCGMAKYVVCKENMGIFVGGIHS